MKPRRRGVAEHSQRLFRPIASLVCFGCSALVSWASGPFGLGCWFCGGERRRRVVGAPHASSGLVEPRPHAVEVGVQLGAESGGAPGEPGGAGSRGNER